VLVQCGVILEKKLDSASETKQIFHQRGPYCALEDFRFCRHVFTFCVNSCTIGHILYSCNIFFVLFLFEKDLFTLA